MKINFFFRWNDFWVGIYYDEKSRVIYICPIPMFGIKITLKGGNRMVTAEQICAAEEVIMKTAGQGEIESIYLIKFGVILSSDGKVRDYEGNEVKMTEEIKDYLFLMTKGK